MVGILKQILRKVLGRACVTYEDLLTVLCDCESVINLRPITYASNDSEELIPLTPVMFLREQVCAGVPDCDQVDGRALCKRIQHLQKLRYDLTQRFRIEYLGQLRSWSSNKPGRQISVGELVVIGNDNEKRLQWPLGRVVEVIPGKDGQIRLVRLETSKGSLLRPVQRLYPLECDVDRLCGDDNDFCLPRPGIKRDFGDDRDKGGLNFHVTDESEDECSGVKSRVPVVKSCVTRSGR
ncbi:uncharacterized protein LOC126750126 [Anthonomus grandis grandis]|uniref:uncharacterized protein LOC126750126 n=1 Tax=Anthonomus grandis grandis TaxID=2921223 RepID=UPI00216605C7|nr:uncharacterized protein LOC126750126 [Anthonomus grandis grandis]